MKPALLLYPHISSYPVLLVLAFVAAWLLARSRAPLFCVNRKDLDNIGLILPATGLFGARFFARLFYEKASFWEALKFWEGDGLVFYGGFILSLAAVVVYGVIRRIRLLPLLDCIAPPLALGLALGRVGCFLAGCCWGDACLTQAQAASISDSVVRERIHTVPIISQAQWPLAVQFPRKSDVFKQQVKYGLVDSDATRSHPVHPVQLYEAVLALGLCWLLHRASKRQYHPGNISIGLLMGYAVIRFCTEFLRADNKVAYWEMTFSQTVSLGIAVIAISVFALRFFRSTPSAPATTAPCKPRPAIG